MNQTAYFFDVRVTFANVISCRMPIGFSSALDRLGMGLLGQNGFFQRFEVSFDLPNNIFHLNVR